MGRNFQKVCGMNNENRTIESYSNQSDDHLTVSKKRGTSYFPVFNHFYLLFSFMKIVETYIVIMFSKEIISLPEIWKKINYIS